MVEEIVGQSANSPDAFLQMISLSPALQIALTILVVGLIILGIAYKKFRNWTRTKKFSYDRPVLAEALRRSTLTILALILFSSINFYIQTSELFDPTETQHANDLTPKGTFAKILNSINILIVAFTAGHIMLIMLEKFERLKLERADFKAWKEMGGFKDDDLFHKCFRWVPPRNPPDEISRDDFDNFLKTKEGLAYLEGFTTFSGSRIGSYEKLAKDPFSLWLKSEQQKYQKYYRDCVSGNNEKGRPLLPGKTPDEIFEIDVWQEEKRLSNYDPIVPGAKPPGYAEKKREGLPKPFRNYIPIGVLFATFVGVLSWWGVDLVVLATASGGIGLGLGFALKETFENYFAYVVIRKDKIFVEGDRISLPSGYNGIVHKITSRITYVRHPLNESIAIVPTRQLVVTEIINYTKEFALVPATVEVGVSYLNDPKQVAAILIKVATRALSEVKDSKGRHLAVQSRCPYLDENKPSCGCDKQFVLDLEQPTVRFNKFNDSSLDFSLWVYVIDYGSQFKMRSDMRMMIYEEFKKYDIRIPWPIRTMYSGDEKKEADEIARLDDERNNVLNKYGIGDLLRGERRDSDDSDR